MASFAPEVIFYIGEFPITNTVINTILVDGFLLALAFTVRHKLALIPGKFQNFIEFLIGGLHEFTEEITGSYKINYIFPFFATFFIFILLANWSSLIPGIGTFGFKEVINSSKEIEIHIVPFIRPLTSDLNATLALAIISLVATHLYAIKVLGITQYLSKFFAFIPLIISIIKRESINNINLKDPLAVFISLFTPLVFIFVGFLEIISEFVKAISLSFRLFGNIFAGEVVLETVNNLFAFIFPIPFMLLELIVGLVQALVFAMLTMVFMVILSTPYHEESENDNITEEYSREEVSR